MIKKNLSLILAILLIVLIILLIIFNNASSPSAENDARLGDNEIENNIENDQEALTNIKKQEMVLEYLNKNISELSPEKEVLGGTFYITSIDFLDENNLIVGYEDGHIALIAEVEYEYIDADNIIINSFNIVSE